MSEAVCVWFSTRKAFYSKLPEIFHQDKQFLSNSQPYILLWESRWRQSVALFRSKYRILNFCVVTKEALIHNPNFPSLPLLIPGYTLEPIAEAGVAPPPPASYGLRGTCGLNWKCMSGYSELYTLELEPLFISDIFLGLHCHLLGDIHTLFVGEIMSTKCILRWLIWGLVHVVCSVTRVGCVCLCPWDFSRILVYLLFLFLLSCLPGMF